MKSFIVLALCFAAALAAPQGSYRDAVIVKSTLDNIGVDGFNYAYETSDGTQSQAQGQLTNAGSQNEALVVRGQYSYVAPDGQTYSVQYTADEFGFHPQGAHLPVAPQ